jgi:predicted nuclease with RNAse H fold
MAVVAGIDVGGARKGFHVAILEENAIVDLRAFLATRDVAEFLAGHRPALVAVDAPPRATRTEEKTRSAERALAAAGFRMQWTRRADPAAWMLNGESLWVELTSRGFSLVETFPTAVARLRERGGILLDLALLPAERAAYPDLLDACLCALAARRVLASQAVAYGEGDELGPIWV